MNLVQPIRDKEMINELKEYFKEQNERNYILFLLGINTGLRISDILRLRVRDVEGWSIFIREKKTKKVKEVKMPSDLKKALREYVKGKQKNEFLIKSRNGKNKPLTRSMAYVILNQAALNFGLDRIGTHSLRKTYGYHHYKQFKDIVVLQRMLNHTDQKETLRYIGIEQDTLNDYQKKFRI
ncbi:MULTISPECIES: tyrosine-type recombinase/integrase [Bacillus cereus group]|uniref:tyrosine-type recombinase/integrase n=1 Tax=Bacillus cereus group TaxID=86661 RepID=UPI0009B70475|nr:MULTISPECIES: tyrosine-type recombinase/integrase [Bacillus cereus group]ARC28125.1 site-specific integrase [Bacillus sp. FDAARGOS_235]PEI58908.1 site-specific integrase [Bacillus toyonensis]PEP10906.1 site-specific integrase [Bacillus toyonensis]